MASASSPSEPLQPGTRAWWLWRWPLDLGLALGLFCALQGALALVLPRESLIYLLWSPLGPAPLRALLALLVGAGLCLLWWGRRWPVALAGALCVLPGVLWALWDGAQVLRAGWSGQVSLSNIAWLPSSLLWGLTLAAVVAAGLWRARRGAQAPQRWWLHLARPLAVAALAGLLLLHHVMAVGETDYRRTGDTAVVLGAAVWSNGEPSHVLYDRVMTGVRLYQAGRVSRLLMTGGVGSNGYSEPRVMRDLAGRHGVPAQAVILDEEGVNTAASVRTLRKLQGRGLGTLLVVSHDHHTARIRLACHRLGLRCYTVPAKERYWLTKEPFYILREVVGFAWYALTFRQ